jgi:hypothetical protein
MQNKAMRRPPPLDLQIAPAYHHFGPAEKMKHFFHTRALGTAGEYSREQESHRKFIPHYGRRLRYYLLIISPKRHREKILKRDVTKGYEIPTEMMGTMQAGGV